MSETECPYKGRRLFGCKFTPRYSKGPSQASYHTLQGCFMSDRVLMAEKYREMTYEGDMCERCGKWNPAPIEERINYKVVKDED